MVLGLIWTIILRFQVQGVELFGDAKNAKDALLYWCKRVTKNYEDVKVEDFTKSWKNGLAFNAIIHNFRPDLIEYEALNPKKPAATMTNAFEIAESMLGIPSLLEPQDVMRCADEKTVIMYLVQYYQYFSKMKMEGTSKKRLENFIDFMLELEQLQNQYEELADRLVAWMFNASSKLSNLNFPNDLVQCKVVYSQFKKFRAVEKPPKVVEIGELEAHLFNIQTKLFSQSRPMYHPPGGLLISDIHEAWARLGKLETERERAIRKELIRLERLAALAKKFDRKASLRESWLSGNEEILRDDTPGEELASCIAAIARHEAVIADVKSHEVRINGLMELSATLQTENYHKAGAVKSRKETIVMRWRNLQQVLDDRRLELDELRGLYAVYREMDDIRESVRDLQKVVAEAEFPESHKAEDEAQRHHVVESRAAELFELTLAANARAQAYGDRDSILTLEVSERQRSLLFLNEELTEAVRVRGTIIGEAVRVHSYFTDADEVLWWIKSKHAAATSNDVGRDLFSVDSASRTHQVLLHEINEYEKTVTAVLSQGMAVMGALKNAVGKTSAPAVPAAKVSDRNKSISNLFGALKTHAAARTKKLGAAKFLFRFISEADEAAAWMSERKLLISNADYGQDESSTERHLRRLTVLDEEVMGFKARLDALETDSTTAVGAKDGAVVAGAVAVGGESEPKVERKRLKALYKYQGSRKSELTFAKGDIFYLLNDSNVDWWSVENASGKKGWVPAKYVKVLKAKRKSSLSAESPPPVLQSTGAEATVSQPLASTEQVSASTQTLRIQHKELTELVAARRLKLEALHRLYKVQRSAAELQDWISDRGTVASSRDTGNDMEQLIAVQSQFDEFLKEMAVKQVEIDELDSLAAELQSGSSGSDATALRAQLNQLWGTLTQQANERKEILLDAAEIQGLLRDVGATRSWIEEKLVMARSSDFGKDLTTAERLIRTHDGFERELTGIGTRLKVRLVSAFVYVIACHVC